MKLTAAILVSILGAFFAPAVNAQEKALTGHWEGAVVMVAAEQEVDVVVDFNRTGEGKQGELQFPLAGDGAHEINDLKVEGAHVSFSVRDKAGVVSAFSGDLSSDGALLQGTMKESGQSIPFTLRRSTAAGPAREVAVHKLSGDGSQLKEAFNRDAGNTRMLLLLNLGSFSGKVALRVVQRYVMDSIKDSDLRLYVVWRAPAGPEAAKIAKVLQQDTALATDPRITHFWYDDRSLAAVFEPMLAPYQPVSNPCLLFAPGRSWTSAAPLPDRFRQSLKAGAKGVVQPGQKLNGIELAWDVQTLLDTKKGR
jgi:hypothetical protein